MGAGTVGVEKRMAALAAVVRRVAHGLLTQTPLALYCALCLWIRTLVLGNTASHPGSDAWVQKRRGERRCLTQSMPRAPCLPLACTRWRRVHHFRVLRCLLYAAHSQVVPTVLDLQDVNVRAPPFPRPVPTQRHQRAPSPTRAMCVPVRR